MGRRGLAGEWQVGVTDRGIVPGTQPEGEGQQPARRAGLGPLRECSLGGWWFPAGVNGLSLDPESGNLVYTPQVFFRSFLVATLPHAPNTHVSSFHRQI